MTDYKYQHEHDGIWLRSDSISDAEEAAAYIKHGQQKYGRYLIGVYGEIVGDEVDLDFKHEPLPKFERIRRITGYLVGTLDRFNDGKRAEEAERVKHKVD